MKLTISQKIITPNILLMLLALGTLFFGHISFQNQQEETLSLIANLENIESALRDIEDGNDRMTQAISLYGTLLNKDPQGESGQPTQLHNWQQAIDKDIVELGLFVREEKELALYAEIVAQQRVLRGAHQELISALSVGQDAEIQEKILNWSAMSEQKNAALQDFLDYNDTMLARAIERSSLANQRINSLLMWTLILVLLAMSASFVYYRLLIVNPLQELKQQAEEFASGNFEKAHDREIVVSDEIDDLRMALKKMALQLDSTTVSRDKLIAEIDTRKQIEKQLARAQKMEAVGQLTGGIAHDFNNILGIASGNLELLGLSNDLGDKNKKRVTKIEQALKRASDLTDRLLRFSKNQNSDTQLVFVNHLLDNLKLLVSRSFTVSITVNFYLEDTLWPVELPAAEFEDAILNLALNAKDAMPDGGDLTFKTENLNSENVPVDVAAKIPEQNLVKVSVSDTGTGMSEEVLNRITEPFFSTKSTGKGSGLGLSMVYGFISRAGGHMTVMSSPGEGSTFSLYFPASERQPEDSSQIKEQHSIQKKNSHLTILIVDDEPELLEVTALRLKTMGYNTITAGDGVEAIATLESGISVGLLLSDIVMPGELNGLQLAQKAHQRFPKLPVVLTSGYSQQLEQQENTDDPYLNRLLKSKLAKPYTQEQLQLAIEKALQTLSIQNTV